MLNQPTSKFLRVATLCVAAVSLTAMTGCAVTRDQSSVGAYVDDTAITTAVKAKFVEDKSVDAAAISVETLNGTVLLAGFAKNAAEKSNAETIARSVKGVKSVDNRIVLRA
jgi:hyperosmotically inducible periplasmic protein